MQRLTFGSKDLREPHSVMNEEQWKAILRSEIWDFQENESDILPALRLSYQCLPSHLKQCFAYCAVFPKGYKFDKEKLVLFWIAQGFILPKTGRRMEDVGSDYFDNLMNRSFFQEAPADSNTSRRYLMHDLIHNLAKFVSGDECFGMEVGDESHISRNVRHLSFLKGEVSESMYGALYRSRNLRTILTSSELRYPLHDNPFTLFAKMNCLRVLDLSMAKIHELPSSIGNLKHLRYLDLSMTHIKTLNKTVCRLLSLQTLKLNECKELLSLPKHLISLTNLRHLDLEKNHRLISMPPGMGRLTGLQTLSTFVVGVESGCKIGELKDMRNLRGTLCISNLENVAMQEANQAALNDKPHLRRLKLLWRGASDNNEEQEVLAGLRPHQNIKELQIEHYGGARFPGWIGDYSSLSNLATLSLNNCWKCSILPPLGQLPVLKSLIIASMPSVKYVDDSFCGAGLVRAFPSLEILAFDNMASFLRWDGLEEGDIPRLRTLTISSCLKLTSLPKIQYFCSLEHLEISDCSQLPVLPKEAVPVSLSSLIINSCPYLRRWYETDGKTDLDQIVLNREVTIDGICRSTS